MLGVKSYPREYIDGCRAKVEADVSAYRELAAAVRRPGGGKAANSSLAALETAFFNNMVIVLDALFVHRLRTVEGKDGNPLNEVRLLCNSLMNNGGTMTGEKAIKYSAEQSVLKYQPGDAIEVDEADFETLASAFFAEIASRYP